MLRLKPSLKVKSSLSNRECNRGNLQQAIDAPTGQRREQDENTFKLVECVGHRIKTHLPMLTDWQYRALQTGISTLQ